MDGTLDISEIRESGALASGRDVLLIDLTVERALGLMTEPARHNYRAAYDWFIANTGTYGSRLYGERLPGVDPDFAHCAQRGIHIPSRQRYALSVTVAHDSIYSSDKALTPLDDGTWLLVYSAHRNNRGDTTDEHWNQGLINCLNDGVPVGVFIQERSGGRYYRALAFVEEYNPESDTFTLHGPVTSANETSFSSPIREALTRFKDELGDYSVESLMIDQRQRAIVERAVRVGQNDFRRLLLDAYEGRCAMTGCSVEKVLQAAHIIEHRGRQSNVARNGLLLRADVHVLFDHHYLGIDPDTSRVVVSKEILDSEYGELKGRRIRNTSDPRLSPDPRLLGVQYKKFLQREKLTA